MALINYSSHVSNDVVIELYKVDWSQLDVGVVQILGVLVENNQLLLRQVDNLWTRINFVFVQTVSVTIILLLKSSTARQNCSRLTPPFFLRYCRNMYRRFVSFRIADRSTWREDGLGWLWAWTNLTKIKIESQIFPKMTLTLGVIWQGGLDS